MERLLERLRQPAYTGENRCTPCTLLNLLVAGVGSAALAVVSPVAAGAAFGASVLVIYLRGYLVPGTPTITARYFPESALDLFGKERSAADRPPADRSAGSDRLAALGAVESSADGRRLDPDFRRAWSDALRGLDAADVGPAEVAAALGVDPDAVSAVGPTQFFVSGERLVRWPSEAALVADAAAGRVLDGRPAWAEADVDERLDALANLRRLRRDCPACGESLVRAEETVESCCQPPVDVAAVTCEGCDALLAEARVE